jgi:hypothetical protein
LKDPKGPRAQKSPGRSFNLRPGTYPTAREVNRRLGKLSG